MRCLALAQAWMDAGGTATFAVATIPPSIGARLVSARAALRTVAAEPGSAADAAATVALARQEGSSWVVLDGYRFDAEYQRRIKAAGIPFVLVDDDGHGSHYCADVVLNQNFGADVGMYEHRETSTRLLLGPRYVLLRREFADWAGACRTIPDRARTLLVTLGGGRDGGLLGIVRGLRHFEGGDLEAVVVAGPGSLADDALDRAVRDLPFPARVAQDVTDMPALMAWADIAVIAAGGTLWEALHMGAAVMSYVRHPVQERIVEDLARVGAVRYEGYLAGAEPERLLADLSALVASETTRRRMSLLGREIVDGRGARRVVDELATVPGRVE